jgi:hypothetical protein
MEWWSNGVVEQWSDGVLEYWSDGVREWRSIGAFGHRRKFVEERAVPR